MKDFKILKNENYDGGTSLLLHDNKNNFNFWIDCWIIDGYGNKKDFKTTDLYIDWEFNQYIFYLYDENDLKAKEYQENGENIDNIQYFIDDENDNILNLIERM